MKTYHESPGDDLLHMLSILIVVYAVVSAALGLPGGEVGRGFLQALRILLGFPE